MSDEETKDDDPVIETPKPKPPKAESPKKKAESKDEYASYFDDYVAKCLDLDRPAKIHKLPDGIDFGAFAEAIEAEGASCHPVAGGAVIV